MHNTFTTLAQHVAPNSTKLRPHIHHTPVLESARLNQLANAELFFKCEQFQVTGSFKFRGALTAIEKLSITKKNKGVATHSSGNHGQALAKAAQLNNIACHVVMPNNSPEAKKAAVIGYGASVTFCEPTLTAREETLQQHIHKSGATFIPPYNHEHIILGQASCAFELNNQIENLDHVIAPVGGGGLLAGTLISMSEFRPNCNVWGAEPMGADDAYQSFQSGELIPQENPKTIADGLRTSLGSITWPIIKSKASGILVVSDQEIIEAMKEIYQYLKVVVEPSCAVTLAAVKKYPKHFTGKRVGLILTGGNVDLEKLPFS